MLREIQRTGDIFFPKRWMDVDARAAISRRRPRPPSARFLDRLPPTYPDRLRRIILSSADDLFRAARAR